MNFLTNLFQFKKKSNNNNNNRRFPNDYNKKIKSFQEEFNKSVNDFNIKTHEFNQEKFGIVSNNIKTGIFNNKEQFFKCVQINPFLKPIEIDKYIFSNQINLNELKKEKKIDHKLGRRYFVDIDFGDFEQLNLDLDDKLESKYILSSDIPSGIFGLFHLAYANHKNIFIRPDDLWFHIVIQLQILIDNNAEELRNYFVNHQDKKNITIDTDLYSKDSFIDFITKTNEIMESDVKNDFIQLINTKFSSTSNFDITLTKISSMCAMKHYFSFTMSELCGIRNIFFGGELDDWIKIKTNLEKINNFSNTILSNYVCKVIPIVDKFIEAIETKPDIDFFNKVMRQDAKLAGEFSLGYGDGSEITRYVDGWIIDLYSSFRKLDRLLPSSFEEYKCECEFDLSGREKSDGTKEYKKIYTSNGIGFKFHEELDGYSLIKAWWVCNKVDNN